MKSLDVIEIWWVDSETTTGWLGLSDLAEELKEVPAIGILVYEGCDFITLCISLDPDTKEFNPSLSIPKSAIRKRKTLCRIKMK